MGSVGVPRLRPSFETPEASAFAKAMADRSSGKPALSRLVMHQLVCRQIDGNKVIGSFGGVAIRGRMILEPQLFRVDDYSQITELGIVVIFENDLVLSVRKRWQYSRGPQRRTAVASKGPNRVATISGNNIRGLSMVLAARKPLVIVRVTRKNSVRPDASFGADGIDIFGSPLFCVRENRRAQRNFEQKAAKVSKN
jgi:hypothetical protein